MKISRSDRPARQCPRQFRRATMTVLSLAAIALSACGGGGVMAPGSGGTGTGEAALAVGPISGFGSIIVNGIRYDDSSAIVSDDRGSTVDGGLLRLGMMVQVRGRADSSLATGSAESIQVFSEIKGTVSSVATDTFVVAGRTVRIDAGTVRDGFAALVAGDFVEVYGFFDSASGEVVATRVERKTPDDFKTRGVVTAWNQALSRFEMGSTTVDYTGVSLPAAFDVGRSVRVYSDTAPAAGPLWQATSVRLTDDLSGAGDDGRRAEVEGIVSGFVSRADFRVAGVSVDALNAAFDDGTIVDLIDGAIVEVEGLLSGNRLVATRVEFESRSGSGGGTGSNDLDVEIKGRISSYVSRASFVVRNTRIDASADTVVFDRGVPANLGDGVCVEIEGRPGTDAQGTIVRATEVKFDDDCL